MKTRFAYDRLSAHSALLALACAVICTSPLCSQTDASANRGKQIVDQAVAALGGEKFLHLQNRVVKGRIYSFFHDQLSGYDVATTYIQYLDQKPAKGLAVRERELLGKKQDYSYLFLEDQGWDVTYRGARPVDDETWQRYYRSTWNDIFYILRQRLNEPGMQFEYGGTQNYLASQVDVVDIIDATNATVRVFFDHNSRFPLHQRFEWMDLDTREHNEEKADFDKYRDVGGGVMLPYSIERERNGYKSYQMFAHEIQAEQPLPPRIFDLPPGSKVLKKVE